MWASERPFFAPVMHREFGQQEGEGWRCRRDGRRRAFHSKGFLYIQSSLASLARSFIARGSVQEISDDRPRERSERGENFGDEGVR